jgi:hypothetical protein
MNAVEIHHQRFNLRQISHRYVAWYTSSEQIADLEVQFTVDFYRWVVNGVERNGTAKPSADSLKISDTYTINRSALTKCWRQILSSRTLSVFVMIYSMAKSITVKRPEEWMVPYNACGTRRFGRFHRLQAFIDIATTRERGSALKKDQPCDVREIALNCG